MSDVAASSTPASVMRPVKRVDEVVESEDGHGELRDDEQPAGGVDAPQVGLAVGRDRCRSRRVDDTDGIPDDEPDEGRRGEAGDAEGGQGGANAGDGERWQDDGGETHAKRLAHLPDPHREATFGCAEPPEDQASTRRMDRRARGTNQEEEQPALDRLVDRCGAKLRKSGNGKTERQDPALAPSIRGGAPRDERAQDPGDRSRDEERCRLESEPFGAQRGNQEGKPVLRGAAGGQAEEAHRQHDPPARVLLLVHGGIVW